MIHSSGAQGHYLVTANLGTVYVQVVGLGSMNNCFSLQDFLQELHGKGYCQFIFDLKECRGFDSSFMGVLIGLCNRHSAERQGAQAGVGNGDTPTGDLAGEDTAQEDPAEGGAGLSPSTTGASADTPHVGGARTAAQKVIIVNCGDEHRKLLSSVGVDRVVEVCQQPVNFPVPEAKLSRVKQESVGMERQLRSIVKAHHDLIQLDGANEEKFGAFLNLVRQELKKHG